MSYTIGSQGSIYSVDVSVTAKTITLPAASTLKGQFVTLKDSVGSSGSNAITVVTTGLDRFEYSNISTLSFSYPYGAWTFLNDGSSNWFLTEEYLNTLFIQTQ